MAGTTPQARSLDWARKRGWDAWPTERWKFRVLPDKSIRLLVRVDAFGFGDILCTSSDWPGALLLQTTTADHAAARVKKIMGIPEAVRWLERANLIEVHGWYKNARNRWVCNRWRIGLQDGRLVHVRVEDEAAEGVSP